MKVRYDFTGSVALVTGGATGMGRATAVAFAAAGAAVMIADLNEVAGAEVIGTITAGGGTAKFARTDVSDSASVQNAVARTVDGFGRLDIAFNNAGITCPPAMIHEIEEDAWEHVIAVNQRSVFLCMKYEIRQMLAQGGGVIVNTASTGPFDPVPYMAPYTAAKSAVVALSRTAAVEYAHRGIRVNALVPGTVMTPMMAQSFETGAPGMRQLMENYSPMRRMGEPEEVADAVLWLSSTASSYVTGTSFVIDGGHLAGTHGSGG
jgi:NAD(P)-dependent dehydrogenase (short-subunit alcohol dehydrogenase family)